MDFQLSEEQIALQDVARDFFAEHSGIENARRVLDGLEDLLDPRAELAELGALGLLAGDDDAGTVLDLAVVAEQAGRQLSPSPLVATAGWAVPLLAGLDTPAASGLLADATKGTVALTVAEPGDVALTAAGTLRGTTQPALDGLRGGAVLTLASSEAGPALVLVAADAGQEIVRQQPLDATRGLARITFADTPATVLATGQAATARWARAFDIATVVLAAEDLGTISEAVRRAVAYALEREAFGRPIGGFQAVKHHLVEAYVYEEQLRSLVWLAAWAADARPGEAPLYAAAAAAYAAEGIEHATYTLVHTHGGIGFTWEHDAHLFWRRAKVDRLLLGDVHDRRARVGELALTAVMP
jgi:alkylation response protein AidB-like acyl-CoA dehydrogenase